MLIIANTWRHLHLLLPDKEYTHGTVEIFSVLNGLRSLQFPPRSPIPPAGWTNTISVKIFDQEEAQVEAEAEAEHAERRQEGGGESKKDCSIFPAAAGDGTGGT